MTSALTEGSGNAHTCARWRRILRSSCLQLHPRRDVFWNKGQKPHPLWHAMFANPNSKTCPICSKIVNWLHLSWKKIGERFLCQNLTKPFSVEKIRSIVAILLGTFTEDKEKNNFHLDLFSHLFGFLLSDVNIIEKTSVFCILCYFWREENKLVQKTNEFLGADQKRNTHNWNIFCTKVKLT